MRGMCEVKKAKGLLDPTNVSLAVGIYMSSFDCFKEPCSYLCT